MDSGSLITGSIIVLVLLIPFILLNRNSKLRKKKILTALHKAAAEKDCKIARQDIWNDTAIGIDSSNSMVFFYKKIKEQQVFAFARLEEYYKCRVINSSRVVKNNAGNYTLIDKLELGLSPHNKTLGELQLPFFDAQSDFTALSDELELADKWNGIINDRLQTN